MAITIPVTHAAKQKNSRRSPKSTGMFTRPPCSLCLTIFVGTGRNGNSLSIMGHESLQTSYPKMPALNSEAASFLQTRSWRPRASRYLEAFG